MKKENLFVILTGVVIGIAALVLTALGNPANTGFCTRPSASFSLSEGLSYNLYILVRSFT